MGAVGIERVALHINRHSKTRQIPAASTVHINADSRRLQVRLVIDTFDPAQKDEARLTVNSTGVGGGQVPMPVIKVNIYEPVATLNVYDDGDLITSEFDVGVSGVSDAYLTEVLES